MFTLQCESNIPSGRQRFLGWKHPSCVVVVVLYRGSGWVSVPPSFQQESKHKAQCFVFCVLRFKVLLQQVESFNLDGIHHRKSLSTVKSLLFIFHRQYLFIYFKCLFKSLWDIRLYSTNSSLCS